MTLNDAAEELAVRQSQMYALVNSGGLPAIQVGGGGQWRVAQGKRGPAGAAPAQSTSVP